MAKRNKRYTRKGSDSDNYTKLSEQAVAKLKEIQEQLEEGAVGPWKKSWFSMGNGWPCNGLTGNTYNGINIWICLMSGHGDNRWYTFNQVQQINGFERDGRFWKWAGEGEKPEGQFGVRKGEKGTKIVHWHKVTKTSETDDGDEEIRSFMVPKVWTVFNHEQISWVEGCEPGQKKQGPVDLKAKYANAAEFFEALGATVHHSGGQAFYNKATDAVTLPAPKAFNTIEDYWATRSHEMVHWTGHKSRCKRLPDVDRFGSRTYAFEELVAEMGSAFLCAELGIEGRLQHVEYIAHWIKVISDDKKALFKAASLAAEAVEYLKGKVGVEAPTAQAA